MSGILEITEKALSMVGMQGAEERSFLSLSGGEKQRIYLCNGICPGELPDYSG